MIKVLLSILLVSFFMSCSSSSQSIEKDNSKTNELKKRMFYLENYPTVNSSYKEDMVLLDDAYLTVLKHFFDNEMKMSLKEEQFEITEKEQSNYRLIVSKFDFKEFKIQVEGPELNIITFRVNYKLQVGAFEEELFEEINKESLEPFDQLIFQEMCHIAVNNIITKVNSISTK